MEAPPGLLLWWEVPTFMFVVLIFTKTDADSSFFIEWSIFRPERKIQMTETIIPHWLTKQAALSPEKTALETMDGRQLSFKELKETSTHFAYKLASTGVEPGDRVAMLSENCVDMVIAIHALSYLQAVAVFINTKLTSKEINYQLKASQSMLLLQTKAMQEEKQIEFSDVYTYEEIWQEGAAVVELAEEISLDMPFTMMFTSGTTGNPKAVLHTYGNHWWSAIGSALNLGLDKQDKWLLPLPMFHVGGLSILIRSVVYGMEIYLLEKYTPEHLLQAFTEKRVTIASIVTVMLRDLLQELEGAALPDHVRCLLLGGGAVPAPLLQQVKKHQLPLFQSYGMTETSSQIVTLSEEDSLRKIGSSGKALFPASVHIKNPDDSGVGEIAVKGPMVFHGYDHQPEATAESFSDGWFKTGDLGYKDSEGFLFVMERRTDLIISGGENIYPSEIENVLLAMQGVEEAAVVGESDDKWGQVPAAFIVASLPLKETEMIERLKQELAAFKVPKHLLFVETLPKTASNKIQRHELAKRLKKA